MPKAKTEPTRRTDPSVGFDARVYGLDRYFLASDRMAALTLLGEDDYRDAPETAVAVLREQFPDWTDAEVEARIQADVARRVATLADRTDAELAAIASTYAERRAMAAAP